MKDQKDVWDSIAPSWAGYRNKIPEDVKHFLEGCEGRVLDLGGGSGRNLHPIDSITYYCVDFSEEMIKIAREKREKTDINSHFFVMDSDSLDFEDDFFDAVLCYSLLHCIEKKEKRLSVLKEIRRVLKPGKKAFISVWGRGSERLKNKEKECFIPWKTNEGKKEERYTYVYEAGELKDEIKEAGLRTKESWEDKNINVIATKK